MIKTIYIRKLRYNDAKSTFLREIEKAFISGEQEVEVIHGIGTYTLRKMVLEQVEAIEYLELVENHNPGSLRIRLLGPEPEVLKKYMG